MNTKKCGCDIDLVKAISTAVFYELNKESSGNGTSGQSSNNSCDKQCCNEKHEDKHQNKFYIDPTNKMLVSALNDGTEFRISGHDLAEIIKGYIVSNTTLPSPAGCGIDKTVVDVVFDVNPNNPQYIIKYCDGHEDKRDLRDLIDFILHMVAPGVPPTAPAPPTAGDEDKYLTDVSYGGNTVIRFTVGGKTLSLDLFAPIRHFLQYNPVTVQTDGTTILGDGTGADPLRVVGGAGGGGGGGGGNVLTIDAFKREGGDLILEYTEDGALKRRSLSVADAVSPVALGGGDDKPTTTQGTSLPTKVYGEEREGLLGKPNAWGKVAIGSDVFLVPLYKAEV